MDTRFRPALQSFEERLAPATVASSPIGGMYTMDVGVVLPGTDNPPPPPAPTVPPLPPPPPPPTGGM